MSTQYVKNSPSGHCQQHCIHSPSTIDSEMLQEDDGIALASATDKGKGKEREEFDLAHNHSFPEQPESPMYPPIGEDAEETRRVEENLRRWEVAERQRRKAARESQSYSAPSLVSNVSRRASLLFSGRKGRQHSISNLGNHAALQSRDSIDVPLTYAVHHTPSPTRSEHERDPFANQSASVPHITISPFDDVHAAQDFMSPPTALNKPTKDARRGGTNPRQPPSPPKPLNIPPPRSPPPIFPVDLEERNNSETVADVRWWHDWLCGCGEGPDRGGDYQAGHTNPLE